eukprot:TRINITY_DN19763_c0_g2_i2.p1 TRINITY_DN19763_c0_g2~~TRINITY_DN19763_c0_g2_i2.p1  ORF type:complete len:422 (+),score=49.29 TRINITY_DN19763_c0_g2_i2:42-1307(+)
MFGHPNRWCCIWLCIWPALFQGAISEGNFRYVQRETVRIGHAAPVQLDDVEGGRTVDVVTVGDETTGLPIFKVDNFLSPEECDAIKEFASKQKEMEKSHAGGSYDLIRNNSNFAKELLFDQYDGDKDGKMSVLEIETMLEMDVLMLLDGYNHSEMLELEFGLQRCGSGDCSERPLTKKQFVAVNWRRFLVHKKKISPTSWKRSSAQVWVEYNESRVTEKLQEKVAAVTGLSLDLVINQSEDLQVLRYVPGSLYTCHHDNDPEEETKNEMPFRYITFFLYLNDVDDGGDTVFWATDRRGNTKRLLTEEESQLIETHCSARASCCPQPGQKSVPPPFEQAVHVSPKKGQAVFWYNANASKTGRGLYHYANSLHAGCPPWSGEKWGANVWINGFGGKVKKWELTPEERKKKNIEIDDDGNRIRK